MNLIEIKHSDVTYVLELTEKEVELIINALVSAQARLLDPVDRRRPCLIEALRSMQAEGVKRA